MTIPKIARVRDMVLAMLPTLRHQLSPVDANLAGHLRGNAPLYESLIAFITSRIQVRDSQPVPSDPVECRGILERNHELRVLLARLESAYRSPINQPAEDGEPAA